MINCFNLLNKIILLLLLLCSCASYSQIEEGQNFCVETKGASYFPLHYNSKKKLRWGSTFYYETNEGTKEFNGKSYIEFKQEWEDKNVALLYLREENGVIYQYEKDLNSETIRYDPAFEKGHTWKGANGKSEYKIISFEGKLRTPYCKEYTNLLVIAAKVDYGSFNFFYMKGHGYIGAAKEGKLISCETPE